jgi:hypothetical protein
MDLTRAFRLISSPRLLPAWIVIAGSLSVTGGAAGSPTHEAVARRSAALALPFIENRGEVDARVRYYAQTFAGRLFVTRDGEIVYSLASPPSDEGSRLGLTLREVLVGARIASITGEAATTTRVSSFQGRDRSRWRNALPAYGAVSFGEVYPGIGFRLMARGQNVEKLFEVKPGATAGAIRLRVDGARGLRVAAGGELIASTDLGPVTFTKPIAFQESAGRVVEVGVRYTVHADGGSYGFEVDRYDATRPLVIDPLLASTFVGGRASDRAMTVALDRIVLSGPPNVFIAGWTVAADFPTAPPGRVYDATANGADDVFVAKLDGTLTRLLAATFLGGRDTEEAWGVAVGLDGSVYVTGRTNSHDFPTLPGAFRRTYGGGRTDAFVAKLDNGLENLLASTLLGGEREDRAQAIALGAVDGREDVYVTGHTNSRDFPTYYGGQHDGTMFKGHGGRFDVFVARLTTDHLDLNDSIKLGGIADDFSHAIAVGGRDPDRGGSLVVITGCSQQPQQLGGIPTEEAFYPTTIGAYDDVQSNDQRDAFVSVLSGDLAALRGSTFLGAGGAGRSRSSTAGSCGHAVTMTADGAYGPSAIYVAGMTESPEFPTTEDAYDRTKNDRRLPGVDGPCREDFAAAGVGRRGDAFVAKFTGDESVLAAATLNNLAASTYLGGCATDTARALALDGSGNVFVSGYTYSSDFPATAGAYDESANGEVDAFVSKLDGDLGAVLASTFLGGPRSDFVLGLALDGRGDVYVTGYTRSLNFPTTPGAYDRKHNGALDAFVSKFDPSLEAIGID